jgi:hypothetical protein
VAKNGTGRSTFVRNVDTSIVMNAQVTKKIYNIPSYLRDIFMTLQNNLANRLLYLPIDLNEKVLLWLTYKGQKPVSNIVALRRDRKYLRLKLTHPEMASIYKKKEFDYNSESSVRLRKWITDADLQLVTKTPPDSDWYVGKNISDVQTVANSIQIFDQDHQIITGTFLGFPQDSVIAYAQNLHKDWKIVEQMMTGTGKLLQGNDFLRNKYYTPYIFYSMTKSGVKGESQVAKRWADTIRKDIPRLAKWFEDKYGK